MPERPDNAIVPVDPRADVLVVGSSHYAPYPATPSAHAEQPNILRVVHGSLRGRYPLVIALALVAAVAAGAAGFFAGRPMYRSEALVRIQPRLPKILHESEQTAITPMFTSFVNTQANLIQQERVITRAINSDKWRALGRPSLPEDVANFRRSIRVNTSRESPELITVSFTDAESQAAKVGLDEVLKSYETIFGGADTQVKDLQFSILEPEQRSQREKIATLREEIRKEAAEYGTEDLTELHNMRMQQLVGILRLISELELAIAERAPVSGQERPDEPADASAKPATPDEIAAVDRLMAEYMTRRREMDRELTSLQSRGVGASHDSVKLIKGEMSALDTLITDYTTLWNSTRTLRPEAVPGDVALAGESLAQLQARLSLFRDQAERSRQDAVSIGNKRLTIDSKRREITDAQARLAEVTRRLEEINIETKVEQAIGRIEVLYPDSAPRVPTVDPRKKYAVMGGGLAGGAVLAIAFLIGLIDRRCRYSDEVNKSVEGRLLACLPVMTPTTAEEETVAAVHSVHQIRAQMQIVSPDHRTIAITSANAGDGKTSVCLSLGISFANVGRRTLLVDLDFIGHGLSSRLHMCQGVGVVEALAAGTPEGFVRPSHVAGMDVLSVGAAGDASPARLRREEIHTLLRAAARLYDTVLVDTGPLLGSLEANFVCASADGVLLIVGRGQSRVLIKRVIQQLRDINARLLGVVFNRARDTDFRSSTVSASVRSVRSVRDGRPSSNGTSPRKPTSIDPLADAVFVDAQDAEAQFSDTPGKATPAA